MEAGKLKKRVLLQKRTATTDRRGNASLAWGDVANAWSQISPMSGDESQRAGRTEATVTHVIHMRYRKDLTVLTQKDRVVFGSRIFNIEVVRNIEEANDELVLDCVEVVT